MNFVRLSKTKIYVQEEEIIYLQDQKTSNTEYFKCSEKFCRCRGKVVENGGFVVTNDMVHFHTFHSQKYAQTVNYNKLKEQVLSTNIPIKDLYRASLRQTDFKLSGKLNWRKVRNGLQNIRRKQMPSCPNLLKMIELLEKNEDVRKNYGMMRNLNFYQGCLNNNILVFANLEVINLLPEKIDIFIDATFNVCPFKSYQLLIILAEIGNSPKPIIFVMMPNKKQQTYMVLFDFIKKSVLKFGNKKRKPVTAMSDFERGLRNAVEASFPGIILRGCNFHHLQALRRKARKISTLATKVFKNSHHHFVLKMFMRISLLPIEKIDSGLYQLKRYILSMQDIMDDFQEFIIYYESVWINNYKKTDWCVSNAKRRTNNNVEGVNSYIKKIIPRNPSPYIFLQSLLDFSYEISSNLSADLEEICPQKDRSKISKKLRKNLKKLNRGVITELQFLMLMAR